ncbi:hypothetical protein GDO86_007600 [Hymenochirus boettgeri]|uniref:Sushi domain-containing protein n=1 Tax=Hymenochirus boettgeri TaxID=247094 RepID=A0A8T2IZT9_9PIPI|nr:hypothetical protein GDO86_007600 [Hymenochirus boettgeri]
MEEGKKLSLSCTAGYTTQSGKQEGQITCTGEQWEPKPSCFKKCMKPYLNNGNVLDGKEYYKILESAHYSCSEGYVTVSGNQTEEVQCLNNGWSTQPDCHQISDSCEAPHLINGQYSTTKRIFSVNDILQYTCNDGYYSPSGGSAYETECRSRGWSSIPECTKLSCKQPIPVQNGGFYDIKQIYVERDVVQFFCKEGYTIRGSELIQCYSFGWLPDPPICEERRNKCSPAPRPPHVVLLTDPAAHRNGDIAHYECDHNYRLIGSEKIQCENGQWTSPPSCLELKEKIQCDQPPPIEHGELEMESEVYHSGDVVQYKCKEGYEIQGPRDVSCKMGKWSATSAKCKAKHEFCQAPPSLTNGELIGIPSFSHKNGESVEYRCKTYHLMEGSKTVNCTHGRWTEPPICLEPCIVGIDQMRQKNLKFKWNFEMNTYFLHGDIVEFVCKDGFEMHEHSALKGLCQRGSILYPTCRKKDQLKGCGPPPLVKNSKVIKPKEYYESGSATVYTCSDYYFLNGSNTVQCLDGEWEALPSCIEPCFLSKEEMERKQIQLRWSFDNKDYFLHGEFVEFICRKGYQNYQATALFTVRVQCSHGRIKYPICVNTEM